MVVVVVVIVVIVVLVIVVCLIEFQMNDKIVSFGLDRSHDQHHVSQTVGFLAAVTMHNDYA